MSSPVPASLHCFALLDDSEAGAGGPGSRLYTGYVDTISFANAGDMPRAFESMQQALRQGRHAVGLFSYELGTGLSGTQDASAATQAHPAEILLFEECRRLSKNEAEAWLTAQADAAPSGIAALHSSISEAQFEHAVARIHDYIAAGDTYQVNYTYRVHFSAFGSLQALYLRLRVRQPVPYGALIRLPDGRAVLSFSPELFVRHQHGTIVARPMKGTAPASADAQQDALRVAALRSDLKSRAENVMIVDLLRNDLGRIAVVGSVEAADLFDVTRYGSVLQMTSTVQAQLRDDVSLAEVFAALFPCGSVTGAPKRRTMEIIAELEPDARGIYTGAIGWFDTPAPGRRIGNFCMSVPIRTLALQAPGPDGIRLGEMGVGAGIVHDSHARDEYAECLLKAKFLTGLPNDFSLFETMHATRAGGCRHLERHLQRMRASASYFGFFFDEEQIRNNLHTACAAFPDENAYRLRLSLDQEGDAQIQTALLAPIVAPVTLLLSARPTDAGDLFLRHKSTVREQYDAAWRHAETLGAFDTLFVNMDGELTEGGRSNVFLELDGQWFTPPLSSGVLPGVMRALLLENPAWKAHERVLTLADLERSAKIVVCNSLRGALEASMTWS